MPAAGAICSCRSSVSPWFWLVGATFLSQFPTYAKDTLGADEHVVTLFLTVFSVGIGIGSILCNRLLKGEVSAKLVPFAAMGMTIFMIDLYFASSHSPAGGTLLTVSDYLARPSSWRVLIDLVLIAACGGLFIVPLYAILQARSEESHRSRVIAANNIVNALFMVVASVATVGLLALHFTVPQVFLVLAIANLGVAIYICKLLPDELVKGALATILKLAYRVEVRGVENYTAARRTRGHRHQSRVVPGCRAGRGVPAGQADLRHQHLYRAALVGEAVPDPGRGVSRSTPPTRWR